MSAAQHDYRPKPRQRFLILDRGFFVGIGLVVALAWWIRGDDPPGLPGEPELSAFQGKPLLVVYGAPGCIACDLQWRALAPTLPEDLQVVHLAARASMEDPRPATPDTVQLWAETLRIPASDVLPAHLPTRPLPALLLRNEHGRWRFEHTGQLDAGAWRGLQRALTIEGFGTASTPE